MSNLLFTPWQLGKIELRNRVVMAPMTRSRAPGNVPASIVAMYYAQRAEAGLIVTEGTSPSPNGLGYARIPGLFNSQQVSGWRDVTQAIHRAGGRIFVQLIHTGRVSHPLNLPPGTRVLAPSPITVSGVIWTDAQGEQPYAVPREMTEADIEEAIGEFARSAELAVEAGFDGVELHGANGYLIDQFLNTASNRRHDAWGGSIHNRMRFAVEVARRTAAGIGADRVGIRLSPYGAFNDMASDPLIEDTFENLATEIARIGLVYIHLVDHSSMGAPEVKPSVKRKVRTRFGGTLILSGGYDRDRAEADLVAAKADLIAFGRPFIANPKLVTKFRTAPLWCRRTRPRSTLRARKATRIIRPEARERRPGEGKQNHHHTGDTCRWSFHGAVHVPAWRAMVGPRGPSKKRDAIMKLTDPDYCEAHCPICTNARKGKWLAVIAQKIETALTFGGCPSGRARKKKYGVKPSESLPRK